MCFWKTQVKDIFLENTFYFKLFTCGNTILLHRFFVTPNHLKNNSSYTKKELPQIKDFPSPLNKSTCRKIPNIGPGFIEVRKHFLGGLYSGGLYSWGLIFGGHFMLVSEYQDLKIHCYVSLL